MRSHDADHPLSAKPRTRFALLCHTMVCRAIYPLQRFPDRRPRGHHVDLPLDLPLCTGLPGTIGVSSLVSAESRQLERVLATSQTLLGSIYTI